MALAGVFIALLAMLFVANYLLEISIHFLNSVFV